MGCEKYREGLELVTSLDDEDAALAETIAHIKECPKCAKEFAAARDLDSAIREKMEEVTVPPFLAERVRANLGQKAPLCSNRWQWAYVVGVLLFVGGVLFYNQTKIISYLDASPPRQVVSKPQIIPPPKPLFPSHNILLEEVAEHALKRHRNLLNSKFVVFKDGQIDPAFRRKFNFSLALADCSEDFKLVGGRKCHCNYEMAFLLYRQGESSISLCVFPAESIGLSQWQGKPQILRRERHNLAIWKRQDNVYALVGNLPVSETHELLCCINH